MCANSVGLRLGSRGGVVGAVVGLMDCAGTRRTPYGDVEGLC